MAKYHFYASYKTKALANSAAKKWRLKGYYVRIVTERKDAPKPYSLWLAHRLTKD